MPRNYSYTCGFQGRITTQSSASQNNRTRNLGEQLCDDECDGRIITVGHKDQVSSSCITLTLFTPLPDCKCAQFRHPSSTEQTITFNSVGPTLQVPGQLLIQSKHLPAVNRMKHKPACFSCYLIKMLGYGQPQGQRTVKPRTQTI